MNKLCATSVFLFAALCAHAQITLIQSDMPQVGNVFITAFDTVPTVSQGSAGANQTWDLSATKWQFADTTFCVSPSSTPYFTDFPTSNLAVRYQFESDSTFYYSNLGSSSLLSLGNISVQPIGTFSVTDNPGIRTMPLPAAYLTYWTDMPREVVSNNVGADSLRQISQLSIFDTIDGWGTVTTPAGSYSSLRVKQIQRTVYDSAFYYSTLTQAWALVAVSTGGVTSESFIWYAASKGAPVATVSLDSLGGHVGLARYLASSNAGITQPVQTSAARINQRSGTNYVTIATPMRSEIKILNIQGRLIQSLSASGEMTTVNISSFPSGLYFLKVNKETEAVLKR